MAGLIKSVSYSQWYILRAILDLHVPEKRFSCDPTYSIGNFYKGGDGVPEPEFKFDIDPRVEGVVRSDCRELPFEDGELKSIIFDPPFLATKGPSLSVKDDSNKINKRFSVFPTEKQLHEFYKDSLIEFHRVLCDGGILVFKCQDKVSSGTQYFSHVFVHNTAVKVGFYPIDFFLLVAENRIVANWQRSQKHARKYHSYFWVFKKSSKVVRYA